MKKGSNENVYKANIKSICALYNVDIGDGNDCRGSMYPLIKTDNGRYIAFQVVGLWHIGLDNGVGITSEHWYDFTDDYHF